MFRSSRRSEIVGIGQIPLSFIAQKTDGFSGADLAELCQRAAKAAIRDAIAAEELKASDGDVSTLLFESAADYCYL